MGRLNSSTMKIILTVLWHLSHMCFHAYVVSLLCELFITDFHGLLMNSCWSSWIWQFIWEGDSYSSPSMRAAIERKYSFPLSLH